MSGPAEVYIAQMARSSPRALRFLQSRGLQSADVDDVISEALAWCWEHRTQYSLVTSLETWFVNAVRHAHEAWTRHEIRQASDSITDIPTADTTLASAESISAAHALISALPWTYRRVVWLEMRGYSRRQMMERGISEWDIRAARERVTQLRRLLPDPVEYQDVIRAVPLPASDDPSRYHEPASNEAATRLGNWVHQQPGRTLKGQHLFGQFETHASLMRERLNKNAGLPREHMPTYVPSKHWRSEWESLSMRAVSVTT